MKITKRHARKIVATVDRGLSCGLGEPRPGEMCVEAAVCFALGLPHGDNPPCVSPVVRALKIELNDSCWSTNAARAKGMRKLAVLQLGTNGPYFDTTEFVRQLVIVAYTMADRAAATAAATRYAASATAAASAAAASAANAAGYAAAASANAARYAANAVASANAARYAAAAAAANAAGYAAAASANAARYAARPAATAAAARYAASAADSAAAAAAAAANAARYAANAAAGDKELRYFSNRVCRILASMKVPAVKWLDVLK